MGSLAQEAPLRLDAFMARANAAYYAHKNPFADFTTAPEISQMFGELLGAWAAVVWQQMGAPHPVLFVEAGPGRGTLMHDALRLVSRVAPDFGRALKTHFIETSPRLRAEQAARQPNATWHDSIETIPPGPAIFLANEFFDALPIRQFVRTQAGWSERFVAGGHFIEIPLEATANDPAMPVARMQSGSDARMRADNALRQAASPGFHPGYDASPGDVVEWGEAAAEWTEKLAQRLVAQGGAALIADYGTEKTQPGETLQALRNAKPADPLAHPGTADLTAHVDFAVLARVAQDEGAAVWGPVTQGVYLGRLGLWQRTKVLSAQNPVRANDFVDAANRLAAPSRMGNLFKAMCISAPGTPPPPGFVA